MPVDLAAQASLAAATGAQRALPRLSQLLAIGAALMALMITLAIVLTSGISASHTLQQQIGLSLAELASQTTQRLDEGLAERYREIRLLSQRSDLFNPASPAATRTLLEQLQSGYQYYAWIGVTDLSGHVLASTQGLLTGADVAARPWWGNALKGKNLGDVHEAKLLERLLPYRSDEPWRFVDVAFTYHDRNGIDAGVVGAHLSWNWARAVQRSIFAQNRSDIHIDTLIVSATDIVLLGPQNLIGTKLILPSLNAAGTGKTDYIVERWPDGGDWLVGYSQVKGFDGVEGLGWKILLRQKLDEAYLPVRHMQRDSVLIGAAIAVLFALFGWFNARRLTRPLSELADAARRIRFNRTEHLTMPASGFREVGAMGEAFTLLIDDLTSKEAALRQSNATLEARVAERTLALEQSEVRLRTIADNMPVLIGYVNPQLEYEFCNATYEKWFQRPRSEILHRSIADVVGPEFFNFLTPYLRSALDGNRTTFEYEQAITEPPKYLRSTYLPERAADGSVAGLYILVVDITEQKRAERELQHSALHDFLTGLPNRALLMSHLDQTLALSARRLESCAVMYLDIDRFKAINDSYGHAVGDQVLVQFTRRLRSVMRDADLLARLGGDEFVIVATELPSGSIGALHFAQRIVDSFAQPLEVDDVQYEVHTSVGVAVSCGSSENKEDLLRRADSALYKAKAGGRNTIYMAAPND